MYYFFENLGIKRKEERDMKLRKIKRHTILIGLTLLVCSFFLVAGVSANGISNGTLAHKTPITFEFTNVPDGTFEKEWYSAHGRILHMRGSPHDGFVWGNLDGDLTYVGDIELNMETFDGTGQGIVCFDVNYGELSGTFEGRMVIKVNGGYITAMFVCHGDGDFEGMHLKGTCEGFMFPGVYSANAVLLNPNA